MAFFASRELQPAAEHELSGCAGQLALCRLRSVFSPAHVRGKYGLDFISLSAESETLRGFLDKLNCQ
jgi:hypothetical protein